MWAPRRGEASPFTAGENMRRRRARHEALFGVGPSSGGEKSEEPAFLPAPRWAQRGRGGTPRPSATHLEKSESSALQRRPPTSHSRSRIATGRLGNPDRGGSLEPFAHP